MAWQRGTGLTPKKLHFQGSSEESSSLKHDLRGLNSRSVVHKKIMGQSDLRAGMTTSIKGLMKNSRQVMTRGQRRNLRKLLKVELDKVLGLSSKLEARELQLRRRCNLTEMNPYLSDAEFSRVGPDEGVHDADSASTSAELPWREKDPHVSMQQPFAENGGILTDGEISFSKDTSSSNIPMHKTALSNLKRNVSKKEGFTADGSTSGSKLGVLSREMCSDIMLDCHAILKKLMKHKYGWVFNEPVDVAALGLRDYHRVVQRPMDLGTIKSKLNSSLYDSAESFASDVRLTFSNAMLYNPQGHDVYKMAEKLLQLFEIDWKPINHKRERRTNDNVEGQTDLASFSPEGQAGASVPSTGPKRRMSYLEKATLVEKIQLIPAPMQDGVIRLMTEGNPDLNEKVDEMEVDIDSFSDETLWELDQYVKECLKIAGISMKSALHESKQPIGSNGLDNVKTTKGKGECLLQAGMNSCVADSSFNHTRNRTLK